MRETEAEIETLQRLATKWRSEGYEVVLEPRGEIVPSFLQRYKPDAILTRGNEKLVVEVVKKGLPHIRQKIEHISTLFEKQQEWKFEVVYSGEAINVVPGASIDEIRVTIDRAKTLARTDIQASLLLTWASLEAIVRRFFPKQASRPQSPGRVVELLASVGKVTPVEAELLRKLMKQRNEFVHGALGTSVESGDLLEMQKIADFLAASEDIYQ